MFKRSAIIVVAVLLAIGILGTTIKRVSSPVVSSTQSIAGSQFSDPFSSFDGQLSPDGPLAVSLSATGVNQTDAMPPEVLLSLVVLSALTFIAIMHQRKTQLIY